MTHDKTAPPYEYINYNNIVQTSNINFDILINNYIRQIYDTINDTSKTGAFECEIYLEFNNSTSSKYRKKIINNLVSKCYNYRIKTKTKNINDKYITKLNISWY